MKQPGANPQIIGIDIKQGTALYQRLELISRRNNWTIRETIEHCVSIIYHAYDPNVAAALDKQLRQVR